MNMFKRVCVGLMAGAIAGGIGLPMAPVIWAQQPSSSTRFFQRLMDFLSGDVEDRGRGGPGGSRGSWPPGTFCVINPGEGETLWSTQPLFIVAYDVDRIEVRPSGETTPLWSTSVAMTDSNIFQATYDGEPLQPGMDYEWVFYQRQFDQSVSVVLKLPFQVMAQGPERDRISTELAQLQAEQSHKDTDKETIADARADYFMQNNLPADAFHELFSLDSPSAELIEIRNAVIDKSCAHMRWRIF